MKTIYKATNKTIQRNTFDSTSSLTKIIPEVAGKKIYVIAFHITNNSTTKDAVVFLLEHGGGVGAIRLYGGDSGAIYLPKGTGQFELPNSLIPWFVTSVNGKDVSLYNPAGARISGFIVFYQE